jgi:hypothetical protein
MPLRAALKNNLAMELLAKRRLVLDVLRAPRVTIDCFGGDYSRSIYQAFNQRHPKLPLFRFKTFGVMLRPVTEPFGGGKYEMMRRKVRVAERQGYSTREIQPDMHFCQILAVNRSSEARQGLRMSDDYINEKEVSLHNKKPGPWFGLFDQQGTLRAYSHTPILGDYFVYNRILGHASLVRHGIMYLLVRNTLLYMQDHRDRHGYPTWAMYDMYIGGRKGLREFKHRTGFAPARVSWRWIEAGGD